MKLYNDHKNKVIFPITVSYKLDGIFCKIINKKPYSKNSKLFEALPEYDYPDGTEGELYNHNLSFEDIVSAVRRNIPNDITKRIEFIPHHTIPSIEIGSAHLLKLMLKLALKKGYEGLVLDTNVGTLKYKPTYDKEFTIVGVVEGKGKLKGKLGSLVCTNFKVKMKGSFKELERLWIKRESLVGKQVTVKYQNKTSKGIPRFPIGVAIRNYE